MIGNAAKVCEAPCANRERSFIFDPSFGPGQGRTVNAGISLERRHGVPLRMAFMGFHGLSNAIETGVAVGSSDDAPTIHRKRFPPHNPMSPR
jgi:hypothetical protein